MSKEKEEEVLKGRLNRRQIIAFFALVSFFILLRFPYGDLMSFAVDTVGKKTGVTITRSDVSYRFPLGVELKDARIWGTGRGRSFSTPQFESLRAGLSIRSLFSDKKVLSFHLKKGGEGKGVLSLDTQEIGLEVNIQKLDVEGLSFGSNFFADGGAVSFSGMISLGHDPKKGRGEFTLSAEKLFLRGLSPLVPVLNLERLNAGVEKSGEKVGIEGIDALFEGVKAKGRGEIFLEKELNKSRISFPVELDVSGSGEGMMEGIISLATGLTGGKDRFNLTLSGTIEQPGITVDGKKLL